MADFSAYGSVDDDPYLAWIREMQRRDAEQQQALPPQSSQPLQPQQTPIAEAAPPPPMPQDPYAEAMPQDPYAMPQPELQVDAVSGADPAAGVADALAHQANVGYEPYDAAQEQLQTEETPSGYLEHFQTPETADAYLAQQQAQLAGEQLPSARDEIQAGQAAGVDKAIAGMTPDEYVQFKARREGILLSKQAELEHQAQLDAERRAREDLDAHRMAVEKADADSRDLITQANTLANTKINPNRYKESRDTNEYLRDTAGIFLMAFGWGPQGAELGLRMLNNRIEQDIDAQKSDIQNGYQALGVKRNAIAEEYARHGDLYRAQETYRIAAYQTQINNIKTELQQYDPAGSMAIRARDALEQLHAAQGQSLQAFRQQQFKNNLDAAKVAMDLRKQQFDEYKFKQEQALKRAGAAKTKEVKFEDVPRTLDELRGMGVKIPADVKLPSGTPGISLRQAEGLTKAGKGGEDWGKAARENSPEELARATGVEQLKDVDGKQLTFIDNKKVAGAYEASDNAVRILDELISLRKTQGGSTDLMKSPEWRKAHVKFANLLLNQKTRDELGALTGSDLQLEAKKLGTSDPTEWRDPRPGLLEARRQIVEGMNTMLRTQAPGQKPARWGPPPPQPPAPKAPEDAAFQKALAWDRRYGDGFTQAQEELGVQWMGSQTDLTNRVQQGLAENHGVLPSIRKSIDDLAKVAKDPGATDDARKDANSKLTQLTNEAESSAVREYATSVRFGGGGE